MTRAFDFTQGILLEDGPRRLHPLAVVWNGRIPENVSRAASFALAYAATVHKAQGSEWPRVLVIDEFDSEDRARWLYTAITRASDEVVIVPRT